MRTIFLLLYLILTFNVLAQISSDFEIEGHRGARGLVPENTIPSFIKAIELGATTVELDVVISKDKKIVVSHDYWFSSVISLDKNGNRIPAEKQKDFNLYQMDYSEIKLYDVGSIGNKEFPEQEKMKVVKPLLKEVFKAVNNYTKKHKLKPVRINIEIKSGPQTDNIFHPPPATIAKMVYDEIFANKMEKQVIVQSFDVRPLQELRKMPKQLPLALLVGNKDGIEKNLELLGFLPGTYSPHFSLVDEQTVKFCHQKGIKIIPWTVNEISDMEKMRNLKVDGIITDFPNRLVQILKK